MGDYKEIIILLAGFGIVAVAAGRISTLFQRIKLPLITGLLIIGILSGPFILKLIPEGVGHKLNFVNDFSLAFIAFAAGAELYLKELRNRMKSIVWMTFGQLVVTFIACGAAVFLIADQISFMKALDTNTRIAIALFIGTIFVARSPASAIAVVNEMRAKGPFTQTAMGVTVLKDVLVIILFAICFTIGEGLIHEVSFNVGFIGKIFLELGASTILGILLGRLMNMMLFFKLHSAGKKILILAAGSAVYMFSHFIHDWTMNSFGFSVHLEPLLICIIGSFVVTNYTASRGEYLKIIEEVGPMVYIIFFTLAGASMSLDILIKVWGIALVLFSVRLGSMVVGSLIGGYLGGDSWKFNRIGWMPYVTQAGVAIGLTTIVANAYPDWGEQFSTVVIAVIVLNQIVGPPLFKWALHHVGEGHTKAETPEIVEHKALIFGLEGNSMALAKQLKGHGWQVKIAALGTDQLVLKDQDIETIFLKDFKLESLREIMAIEYEAIITMLSDEKNYEICELAYEHFGTKDLVVRLNKRDNYEKFNELGALIVEPSSAIVSLLDHMVRSPHATSMLLGMDEGQDSIEITVENPNMHGIALRSLRLPADIIILSIFRDDQVVISHGYSRLRLGDIITLVGSVDSLEKVALKFEAQ